MATLDELIGSWALSLRAANRAPRTVAAESAEERGSLIEGNRGDVVQLHGGGEGGGVEDLDELNGCCEDAFELKGRVSYDDARVAELTRRAMSAEMGDGQQGKLAPSRPTWRASSGAGGPGWAHRGPGLEGVLSIPGGLARSRAPCSRWAFPGCYTVVVDVGLT